MSKELEATLVFGAWLVAYTIIGGLIFWLSDVFLRPTGLDDLSGISVSVVLTGFLGWLGASAIRRRVADRLAKRRMQD
ncbi:hypothetical protein [Phycicoccus sp.]|uniref:hypothetical protein n=1 Tax=Phycicoccus sp. TaxID=1902410 RepID=UPI002B7532A6|nr:hypothetical protein [Phycicoccus sp.]HMM96809.1 hypothetical protein [Phycicoccus sp.]